MKKYISLIRVSTGKQKETELGLRSQRDAIKTFLKSNNGELINSYEEVNSAGQKDRISHGSDINLQTLLSRRPILLQLIQEAKREKATILVNEVTRLTRYSLLFEYMIATGVSFVCVQYPNDDVMMLKMRVMFGEQELIAKSKWTAAGLRKSTKVLGRKWKQNLDKVDRKKQRDSMKLKALSNANNRRASGYICTLRNSGLSFKAIAKRLNAEGFLTSTGKAFNPIQVSRLFNRSL